MNQSKQRQQRLRSLIHKLNQDRKRQTQKIDLLCRDLINAQRDFIQRLGQVTFVAGFYKSLLGVTDLQDLLDLAGRHLQDLCPNTSVTFFLKQMEGFRQYRINPVEPWNENAERLEHGFSDALAEAVCRRGKSCDQDDLVGLGFQVNPALLKSLSLMTLPLNTGPRCVGFMLIYRPGSQGLTAVDMMQISRITQGLAQAVESSEALSGFAL